MASWPSTKSTRTTTRSPSPIAKRCCARRRKRPTNRRPPATAPGDDDADDDDGDDDVVGEEAARRRRRIARRYKIQEVIKRRQIMLVQVVKEERGTKGAALTTYLSLAGRYCVLMPNTARGGGISRKITSATDRKRLKTLVPSSTCPTGMGLIVRTAGAKRTKAEIKRDYEYLMRLWDNIRDHTLHSIAPGADLRGGGPRQARHPRHVRQGHRRHPGRRRRRLPRSARLHAHADAEPGQEDPALRRANAAVRPGQGRGPARADLFARRAAPVRRLSGDQPDRGAGRDRRQLRPLDARAQHRGDRAEDQPGGGRRSGPPASPARPGRPDRHRLHRHGRVEEQPRRREAHEGRSGRRSRARPDGQDLRASG